MEELPTFEAVLRGMKFRPIEAQSVTMNLQVGDSLLLEREPNNPYDSNAIRVIEPNSGEFIGFIAKEVAVELTPYLDMGHEYTCTVTGHLSPTVPILECEPVGAADAPTDDRVNGQGD